MNDYEEQLRSGYLSFSRADLAQTIAAEEANIMAYKLMSEAMETNASYTTHSGQSVNEIYPLSADAVETMSKKLEEAEAAADNPNDDLFQNRLKELRRVVWWSKERHYTFSWLIIFGGLLWILFYGLTDVILSGPDYGKYQAQVEGWDEAPQSYTIEEAKKAYNRNARIYSSATNYKLFKLQEIIKAYDKAKIENERTASTLRYGTLSENEKEIYRHNMDIYTVTMEKAKAEFETANALSFDQWKQKALDEVGDGAKNERNRNGMLWLTVVYFVVIIALYILTNRPCGYMMSRQRATARVTGGILKVLFGIISWLGISGARMGWTDPDKIVTVFWSDGSITKHLILSDLINSNAMFKIIFFVAALTFLMFGSAYLLPILTIIGFFTNIDRKR